MVTEIRMVEEQLRNELRSRLGESLPPELDTDFTLDRWIENYQQQMDVCVEKFIEYLKNRKALGYDCPKSLDNFYSRPDVVNFHKIFSLSKLDKNWINEADNGIVFVEMGVQEPSKVIRAIRVGEYAKIFFGYCEFFQRMVLEHEKMTGRRSYGVCIFDMKLMSIFDYINPMADINRMFEARVNIWMDYYGELLRRVVIVNPPRVLGVVFKMMTLLLPSRFLDRFSFGQKQPEDIEAFISRNAIPVGYGGSKVVRGAKLPNGCNGIADLTKHVYPTEGLIWKKYPPVRYEEVTVKNGESYTREMDAVAGQTLCYEYFANREYMVLLIKDDTEFLYPCFRMSTPILSEEGSIPIKENCHLKLEIKNLSKLMRMKLKIALHLIN